MVGALTLGSAVPHLVNGVGGLEWQIVIVATSVLTLGGGLLAEVVAQDGPFGFPRALFDPRQAGLAWRNRGVRLASLGYFGHMWELYAMWAWFAAFFADTLVDDGVDDTRSGAALATFAVIGIGSINSPMQCMMKEVCAQCLQTHIDPQTGARSHVFSCFNQDQPLDQVDWPGLNSRLRQNTVQEKLTAQWIAHCMAEAE